MSDDPNKYNWMAGLFGPDLWDPPVEEATGMAEHAPHDASDEAGARTCMSNCLSASQTSWTCLREGCPVVKAFSSRWDLARHVRVAHDDQKKFACPYPGCFRGSEPSAFARPDKLTSHIKSCHRQHSEVLVACPATACAMMPSKLSSLAEHIRNDHLVDTNPRKQRERCGDEVEILRGVANAAPPSAEK